MNPVELIEIQLAAFRDSEFTIDSLADCPGPSLSVKTNVAGVPFNTTFRNLQDHQAFEIRLIVREHNNEILESALV